MTYKENYYDEYARHDASNEGAILSGCLQGVISIILVVLIVLLCCMLSACRTQKYVPITEKHTEHHWHKDSVKERDSVHTENTTVIRELDSAAMAKYGIQMQANQRAWLVLQREMENRLREMEHMSAHRDTVRDSIPVPYPVEKQVPAQLTWWQQTRLYVANVLMGGMLIAIAVWLIRRRMRV